MQLRRFGLAEGANAPASSDSIGPAGLLRLTDCADHGTGETAQSRNWLARGVEHTDRAAAPLQSTHIAHSSQACNYGWYSLYEEIDRDFAVLANLCLDSEPANEDQLDRALHEVRRQAKEQGRRQS